MKQKILAFLREEEGLTTVEYAIAGGLVSAALITAFSLLGQNVESVIAGLAEAIGEISIDGAGGGEGGGE